MDLARKTGLAWLLGAAVSVFIGCAAKPAPPPAASKPPEDAQLASAAVDARVHNIQTRVIELQADANQLPGSGTTSQAAEQAHRQLMQKCFADFVGVLPLLGDQYQSSEFRQGMRVLETSRQQLASGSSEIAAEPTIGQGLRALTRLLATLNSLAFDNNAEMAKQVGVLEKRVAELDTVRGATHRVIASEAVRDAADTLQQMTNALAERSGLDVGGKPTTNPAPKPVAAAGTVR